MSDGAFGYAILLLLMIFGLIGLYAWDEARSADACREICHARRSAMAETNRYGCLCRDGSMAAEPPHPVYVYTGGGR